jgi:hypothetical protein
MTKEIFETRATNMMALVDKYQKPICMAPAGGDMNYLFLSLHQAQCLRDELNEALRKTHESAVDDLVIPFPKKETEHE